MLAKASASPSGDPSGTPGIAGKSSIEGSPVCVRGSTGGAPACPPGCGCGGACGGCTPNAIATLGLANASSLNTLSCIEGNLMALSARPTALVLPVTSSVMLSSKFCRITGITVLATSTTASARPVSGVKPPLNCTGAISATLPDVWKGA